MLVRSHFQLSPKIINRVQGHSCSCPESNSVCLGPLACWKMWHCGGDYHQGCLCTWLHSFFTQHWLVSQFLVVKTSSPQMLPPPCFTVRMALPRWWTVPGFLQTRAFSFPMRNIPTICHVPRRSSGTRKVTFRVPMIRARFWMESNRLTLPAVIHVPVLYSSPNLNHHLDRVRVFQRNYSKINVHV